jgi:PhnB protein
MTTDTGAPGPAGASIAPWLSVRHATEALAFYKSAFGAAERYRLDDDSGKPVVAQMTIGEAGFWLQEDADSSPDRLDRLPVRMILTVGDPDSLFERAIGAGATEISPVSEDHGWRIGRIADPFGHHWEIGRPVG